MHLLIVTREDLTELRAAKDVVELIKRKLLMLKAFRSSF